jgi:hypothetical protein
MEANADESEGAKIGANCPAGDAASDQVRGLGKADLSLSE